MSARRILVVTTRFPFPLDGGDKVRMASVLDALSGLGRPDLLCVTEEAPPGEEALRMARQRCGEVAVFAEPGRRRLARAALRALRSGRPVQVEYYDDARAHAWAAARRDAYDVVVCLQVRTAGYARHFRAARVLDYIDSISLGYRRARQRLGGARAWALERERHRLARYEVAVAEHFARTVVIAEADRDDLAARGVDRSRLHVIPNGVCAAHAACASPFDEPSTPNVVFVAKFTTMPNADAARWLLTDVWPRVRRARPDARLHLVGVPSRRRLAPPDPSVRWTGFVPAVEPYLQHATVALAPIRIGAGLQNKVVLALAHGAAVVSTPLAAAPLGPRAAGCLEIAGEAGEFADRVLALLDDGARRTRLGGAGRRFVAERYAVEHVRGLWGELIGEVAPRRAVAESVISVMDGSR